MTEPSALDDNLPRDSRLQQRAMAEGLDVEAAVVIGGRYTAVVRQGDTMYVSGQIPRVGEQVAITGQVGEDGPVTLEHAQRAARLCALRALVLMRQALGSLDRVEQLLRITVYVQCSASFTQHSEVADGASDLLHEVLGSSGTHTRTSVGVYQLPKNATVEMDLIAAVR